MNFNVKISFYYFLIENIIYFKNKNNKNKKFDKIFNKYNIYK